MFERKRDLLEGGSPLFGFAGIRADERRPADDGGADGGGTDRARTVFPSVAISTPSARQRRINRSRSTEVE